MRRSTFLWSILAMSVVVGLFVVKHRVQTLEDRLQSLNAQIITDRDTIQVMQAEWSYLNQPARLEALSKRWLGMDVPVSGQTESMQELLEKSATAPSDTDDIAEIAATKKPTVKPALRALERCPALVDERRDRREPFRCRLGRSRRGCRSYSCPAIRTA